ncbi:phosphoglucosamine mutase, partial [Klebsiella pneumoniae]|nr:phosphoglucosamine mutase [Klebsiella pneumoniae]
ADNGIKLFGPDGYKLSDEIESRIEAMMDRDLAEDLAAPDRLGRVKRIDDAQARYVEIAKKAFPKRLSLKGLRVAVDCANGAAYKVAPTTLYEL